MDSCIEMSFAGPLTAVTFQSLHDDIVRNVLEYIPLVERIKFERVNSSWTALLNDMWLVHKRLAFCYERDCSVFPETKCRIKDHAFVEMDTVHLTYQGDKKQSGVVIQRCPGLKALHIRCHSVRGEEGELLNESTLATILKEKCPELEHIECYVNGFPFLFKFEPKNAFRCYHVITTQPIIGVDEFFHEWTHLKMNSVSTVGSMFSVVKLPSFSELEVLNCTATEWTMFESGMLSKLKVLKLDPYLVSQEAYKSIKNLQLEELSIYINSATDNYLKDILSSKNLKVLELKYFPRGIQHRDIQPNVQQTYQLKQVLKIVVKFAPNLVKFSLWIEPGPARLMEAKYWVEIAKLTKLREFSLKSVCRCDNGNHDCTERKQKLLDGIQLLLQDSKKLRSIRLNYMACKNERDLELLCKALAIFGEEHPKRRIKFYLNDNRIVNDNFKAMVSSNVYLFPCLFGDEPYQMAMMLHPVKDGYLFGGDDLDID